MHSRKSLFHLLSLIFFLNLGSTSGICQQTIKLFSKNICDNTIFYLRESGQGIVWLLLETQFFSIHLACALSPRHLSTKDKFPSASRLQYHLYIIQNENLASFLSVEIHGNVNDPTKAAIDTFYFHMAHREFVTEVLHLTNTCKCLNIIQYLTPTMFI